MSSKPHNSSYDQTSFVSGGSRPTAPIKTAIIRPTNYYDGFRRASFGASPEHKLKLQQPRPCSPIACCTKMSPLSPEINSDPLSDNGAIMYGTNATRRRKSKVEAWIESSSSAQSEESLSENRAYSMRMSDRKKPAMPLPSTSSTLSKEEVDLSFEDLCQELLALSSSCTTLERLISNANNEIKGASQQMERKNRNSPTAVCQLITPGSSVCESDRLAVDCGEALEGDTLTNHHNSIPKSHSQTVLLPTKKLAALTVDVGSRYEPSVAVPVKGSLVTITNPQLPPRTRRQNKTDSVEKQSNIGQRSVNDVGQKKSMTKEVVKRLPTSSKPQDLASTDHVAAAITTQPNTSTTHGAKATRSLHSRSVSEPVSFVTLPPDKRTGLNRSPSKRELKNKQSMRVGLDFIRHKQTAPAPALMEERTKYMASDNVLVNNLDISNQSKNSMAERDKMSSVVTTQSAHVSSQRRITPAKESLGSDSVFDEKGFHESCKHLNGPIPPVMSSTYKLSSELKMSVSSIPAVDRTKTTNESLSSSFESEALDILASLKSAGALKAQLRYGKFPTDVDPVTGSPRQPTTRQASEERQKVMEGINSINKSLQTSYPSSNKSSCLSSPSSSTPALHHHSFNHRSPAHCQTPQSRRSRQSFYDNVSPFGGTRISVASGSSTGTVFSKPWGDLPRLDDFLYNNEEFRHRVGSMVSSQGRSLDSGAMLSPGRSSQRQYFRFDSSNSGSDEHNCYHNLSSIPRFPVVSLPDVALEADMNRPKSSWESAIDRTLNRVRTFTKLLQSTDSHSCEIMRHTQQLLSDSQSLPGNLVGRFHTCTWETNSLDRSSFQNGKGSNSTTKNGQKKETTPKTDWYTHKMNGQNVSSRQAYSNGAYLANICSPSGKDVTEAGNSSGVKEHIVLSNVRQFIDGMKRYLLNQPDTQMMFAIQRERIKLGANQLINLDAIMEAVLERVIVQPLSDHLLNVITTHLDYSIREISQIETGMKLVIQHRAELFASIHAATLEIDTYEQTLRPVFQSLKSEFSPIAKLQYLLQMALLFVLIHSRSRQSTSREQDLQMLFIYAMARYGDATLTVHLAYVRNLIPSTIRNGATAYVLSLFETTVQVYSRIVKAPGALTGKVMTLHQILEKLSCHLMIADESTNSVIRKKLALSRWSTTAELVEIIQVDLAIHDLLDFRLYLATDEKEILLKANDNVSENIMAISRGDSICALVYRRPNTQMLLPPL